jgi:hypothetical protein
MEDLFLINTGMENILHYFVPREVICQILCRYLSLHDISPLDVAMCNEKKRPVFLECIEFLGCIWDGERERHLCSDGIHWLSTRNMKIRHPNCDDLNDSTALQIASFGFYLQCLNFGFTNGDVGMTDVGMTGIAQKCPNIKHLGVSFCKISDKSMIRIAECCHDIETLIIKYADISDVRLSKIAEYCPNLKELVTSS